ncbi:MAG: hypothetical protein JO306_08735 [Gemmatimonadetes bacterium]|nr:hypothetical protein [Gemmatimonadota bacterium]
MIGIFVESEMHRRIVERLLADLAAEHCFRVEASSDRDQARPSARSAQVLSRQPVALVVDADTTDASRVAGQQRDLEWYYQWGATVAAFAVVQFVPQIEIIFFDRADVLGRALGGAVNEYVIVAGQFAPRAVLERLLADSQIGDIAALVDSLSEHDVDAFREHPTVAALRSFVTTAEQAEPARVSRSA